MNIEIQTTAKSRLPEVDFDNLRFGHVFSDHMLVADYADGEWKSCKIVPFAPLTFSPAMATLHYGQSIFEGLKAYKSEQGEILVFRPYDNYKRMLRSAERMCMPPIPEEIFMEGLRELLKLDKDWIPQREGYSLYIRPFMFATDEFIGVRPSNTYKFIIFTCPVSKYYIEPVKVKIETHYTRAVAGGTGYAKAAGNYAASLYPARLAQQQGYHQLIWTDGKTHEYIEEAGTMNIMFRKDNRIITAPLSDSILAGITRDSVLTLAREWGYEVEERPVPVKEIIGYLEEGSLSAAFGVGTAATIAHIVTIGYEGKDYQLPPLEGRVFANRVLKTLDDIKYGRVEDTHGWIWKPEA
ncbi:branched-chain amino acid aminotransferase [Thermonema lapsum]|uniref:branched-chain-amino-acid transaminase n=1 Tax=Thermonema lapsum TaxID=28195 RepID=A0A846MSC7_9BACT|nr:branched-chain amino acid aminotransferase [Thermonema lapsum]